jgi:hypothetical protein
VIIFDGHRLDSEPVVIKDATPLPQDMVQLQGNNHNRKGLKMKHTIIVLVSVALIFASGAASVVSYQHFRTWRNDQAARATKADADMQKATLLQQYRFNRGLDQLKNQCARDHQTYVALTPAQRTAKGAVQDCDPANLQLVQ